MRFSERLPGVTAGNSSEILKNGRTKKVGKTEACSSVLVGRRETGAAGNDAST